MNFSHLAVLPLAASIFTVIQQKAAHLSKLSIRELDELLTIPLADRLAGSAHNVCNLLACTPHVKYSFFPAFPEEFENSEILRYCEKLLWHIRDSYDFECLHNEIDGVVANVLVNDFLLSDLVFWRLTLHDYIQPGLNRKISRQSDCEGAHSADSLKLLLAGLQFGDYVAGEVQRILELRLGWS